MTPKEIKIQIVLNTLPINYEFIGIVQNTTSSEVLDILFDYFISDPQIKWCPFLNHSHNLINSIFNTFKYNIQFSRRDRIYRSIYGKAFYVRKLNEYKRN